MTFPSTPIPTEEPEPTCLDCLDRPHDLPSGICTECGRGTCRACDGEGVTYVMVNEDTDRPVPCCVCGVEPPERDWDSEMDSRRDDELTGHYNDNNAYNDPNDRI